MKEMFNYKQRPTNPLWRAGYDKIKWDTPEDRTNVVPEREKSLPDDKKICPGS